MVVPTFEQRIFINSQSHSFVQCVSRRTYLHFANIFAVCILAGAYSVVQELVY